MSELIDRDELFLQIERARFDVNYNIRTNLGMRCFITEVKYALKCFVAKAPTVEERRHGRWNKVSPAGIYECSNCLEDIMTSDIECYKYCHRCGAIMDESEVTDETD